MASTSRATRREHVELPEKAAYPAYVHAAFVSGILFPLVVIPYVLSRRHTSALRRRLHETEGVVKTLQRELKVQALTIDMMKASQEKSASQISQLVETVESLEKRIGKVQSDNSQGQKALLEYIVEMERGLDTSK